MAQSQQGGATYLGLTLHPNKVTVFSASYCPYCTKVKNYLSGKGVKYQVVEHDKGQWSNATAEKQKLAAASGVGTWPKVYIGTKCIGGCDNTVGAGNNGSLWKMLDAAGVSYNK